MIPFIYVQRWHLANITLLSLLYLSTYSSGFIDNINYKVDKQELGFLLLFAFWSTSDYYKYRIKPSKIFVSFVYPNLSI